MRWALCQSAPWVIRRRLRGKQTPMGVTAFARAAQVALEQTKKTANEAIEAAKAHATVAGLTIDYQCTTAEALAESGAHYDLVYASEVIEHVTDRRLFAASMAAMLAPGGTVVITTINRTLASFALAKVALEYVLRTVPAGTHDPARFVRPAELRDEFAGAGIMLDDMTGFAPLPARRIGGNGFIRVGSLAVNYGASGTHA